jgi:hypothetical protein
MVRKGRNFSALLGNGITIEILQKCQNTEEDWVDVFASTKALCVPCCHYVRVCRLGVSMASSCIVTLIAFLGNIIYLLKVILYGGYVITLPRH